MVRGRLVRFVDELSFDAVHAYPLEPFETICSLARCV